MRFAKTLLCVAVLAMALVIGALPANAQGTTTGSVTGVVEAQDGSLLPGAIITAIHEPTGTRYTSVTREDGRFRILNVRVGGPYTIEAQLEGFMSREDRDLYVKLGDSLDLTFELSLDTVSETVTVVGTSNSLINPTKTGSTSNVSTEAIETLPTIGRGFEDYARTNPFFSISSDNDDPNAISVAGRSSRYNNIQIDGSVNNDLFGLADQGTPGGQADATPISIDAIQELQLVLAPFDVRQGGFSGGGVNAITRSGTNRYKGSVYYFTRDDSLVGDGPDQLGQFGEFSEDQYGFRLGGPISKDKVFFFINGEITDKQRPTGWSLDGSSGQAFANGQAADEAATFRQALIDRYGFDPGGLGEQTRETPSDKYFGRIDFNLNESHNLTIRHNFVDAENDVNRPGSRTFEFESETYLFRSKTNSTVAQLNSVFGPNTFNELRLTNQTVRDRRAGLNGLRFPWIQIERVFDTATGARLGQFEAGTEPFSTRNALDQDIFEITNDFTWLKGNHTITFGTHNEIFSFDNLFIQNFFGAYEFSTLDDFLNGGTARRFRRTLVNPGQPDSQKFDVTQLGFYVGDQWAARDNLTLTYGLRVDIPLFGDKPTRNPFTEATYGVRTDNIPDGEQLWSPRVGFNWDVKNDGRQQLRGGVGVFAGRPPYVWIANNYARTGVEQTFIQQRNVPFNPDPDNQPSFGGAGGGGEFNFIDPNFKFPTVLRINLAYDTQLPWWGLVGSIEGIFSSSIDEIDYKDLNLVQTGTLAADGRPTFTRLDSSVSGAYLITNTGKGEQTNLAIKVERPYRDGWFGFVSYAYGNSDVVNDGTSSRAVSNFQFTEALDPNNVQVSPSDFEVEHRFNAAVSYRFNRQSKYSTTVSAFYNHQSGRPYSTIFGFQRFPSVNNDRYFGNDLIFVPANEGDVVISPGGTWAQLDAYIRNDDCLNSHRGSVVPRNCSKAPWSHSLDLRIAQDIPLGNSTLQITADIENLMNLLNKNSGQLRFARFNSLSPVDFDGISSDGRLIYGLNPIVTDPDNNDRFTTHNTASRWRAKLGVRWSF